MGMEQEDNCDTDPYHWQIFKKFNFRTASYLDRFLKEGSLGLVCERTKNRQRQGLDHSDSYLSGRVTLTQEPGSNTLCVLAQSNSIKSN